MNILRKKWDELMYSLNSQDRYAEYNPNDTPSFNMGRRANNAVSGSRVRLTANMDELGDEEMGFGIDNGEDINLDEFSSSENGGVSEALLAWRHIDLWTAEHNPDLNATLGDPCTQNDISNAEEDLAVALPSAVKVSFRVHDGQEDLGSLTGTSGLIYGLQLMSLDQVVEMTEKWRNVAKGIIRQAQASAAAALATQQRQNAILKQQEEDRKNPNKKHPSLQSLRYQQKLRMGKGLKSSPYPSWEDPRRRQFKLPNIPEQKSVPPNCIQPVYANPGWIPLITDHAGNHIAIDLAPAPGGKYAQVIIFGRDFDTKYVIAENWGDFLLMFANDLEAGNWYLIGNDDDFLAGDGELAFRDKKTGGPILDYLEVLKKRALQRSKKLTQSRGPSNGDPQRQHNAHSFLDDDSLEDSGDIVTHRDLPETGDLGRESLRREASEGITKTIIKETKEPSTEDLNADFGQETASLHNTAESRLEEDKSNSGTIEQNANKKQSDNKLDDEVEGSKEEFENVPF